MPVTATEKAASASAWAIYALIVLEILFMVSSFAAYYYSIYATPLNLLQQSESTAWLTLYLLPHFAWSNSLFANLLILISWPLIGVGLAVFVVGFCQIYWARFTGGGTVAVGLYKWIRHPQYVALAVIGLGTALFWSRYIVWLAYGSMLFVYYALARLEERRCLERYGERYAGYMGRTGRLLPRRLEQWFARLPWHLPQTGWFKGVTLLALYAGLMAGIILVGTALRTHVIDSLLYETGEKQMVLFLAPFEPADRKRVLALLNEAELAGDLAYVAPANWQIPELGFYRAAGYERSGGEELLHPTSHGNSLDFDADQASVLLVEATPGISPPSLAGFSSVMRINGLMMVDVDLVAGRFGEPVPANESRWAGIPVPVF